MLGYAIFMFIVAAVFSVLSVLIYKGKTNLIHDYHQGKVTDKASYGKAFGKALCVLAVTPLASGVIALFGEVFAMIAVAVLLAGIAIGIVCIFRVQKKYNGGVF